MKILISNDETYELKLPETINNSEEFYEILKKLDNIAKIMKLNMIAGTTFNKFKQNFQARETNIAKRKYPKGVVRRNRDINFSTRERVLDIMQYFYQGTKEDILRISKIIGKSEEEIMKRFHNIKERYNIQPQELGFVNFSNGLGTRGIKMQNYIIKSYTGIYDENGEN